MSFFVTNKVKINALEGYSTFVTDEMSQNTLYLLRVWRFGFQLLFYADGSDEVMQNLVDGHVWSWQSLFGLFSLQTGHFMFFKYFWNSLYPGLASQGGINVDFV